MKPKVKLKTSKTPQPFGDLMLLPEEDQARAYALGLTGYVWTARWAICWIGGHGTHTVKKFDDTWQWACLECGVTWRTPAKKEPMQYGGDPS